MRHDRLSRALVGALLLLVAFAFLGSRGLWEPDEGRYVGAAREMVLSGEWLIPQLHGAPHLTKPPLAYWAIAAGLLAGGMNEWGARLYLALAYLATCALAGALGRDLLGRGRGRLVALVFGLSLLPFAAASVATTDMLLAAFETAAVWGWWRARRHAPGRGRTFWRVLTGGAFGLAFLTKGPPGLLPLAALMAWEVFAERRSARRFAALGPATAAAFLLVALPWYVWAMVRLPGLAGYFLGDEVVGRVATGAHHRNAGLAGALKIYGIGLVVGGLPFSPLWFWKLARLAGRRLRRGTAPCRGTPTPARSSSTLLAFWILLPLAVFLASSSRMYLYVVPLFVPLALWTVGRGPADGAPAARPGLRRRLAIGVLALAWTGALMALRWEASDRASDRDARRLATLVAPLAEERPLRVLQIDLRLHGLDFYLGLRTEPRVTRPSEEPSWWPGRPAAPALDRIGESAIRHLLLAPPPLAEELVRRFAESGLAPEYHRLTAKVAAVSLPAARRKARPALVVTTDPGSPIERFLAAEALYALGETSPPRRLLVLPREGRRPRLDDLLWGLAAEGVAVDTARDAPPGLAGGPPPAGTAVVLDGTGADATARTIVLVPDVGPPGARHSRRKNISVSIASQSR